MHYLFIQSKWREKLDTNSFVGTFLEDLYFHCLIPNFSMGELLAYGLRDCICMFFSIQIIENSVLD